MTIFLLRGKATSDARSALENELLASIPGLVEVSTFNRIFEQSSAAEGDAPAITLVVAPPADQSYFDRLVDIAAQYRNQIFLILISDDISASDYKRLVRTGGAEWVSTRNGPAEVAEIIARRQRSETVADAVTPRSRPVTVSFVPSAGGVGNTTLAIETAISIKTNRKTKQRRICIVDLDFQTSNICDYLDSEARLHIEDFSNAPERLDAHLFGSFKTNHSSGIDVFAAPRSKYPSEDLNINALDALFSMIAENYDLVFIDFPVTWFKWTNQVVAASDGVVVTGLNSIPGLRQVSETVAVIRQGAATPKIAVVLNRCERKAFGTIFRRKQAETVLRNQTLFFVARHPEATESVNMGVPMMLGSYAGRLQKELTGITAFCTELTSARVASR